MSRALLNYFSPPAASPLDADFERQRLEVLRRRVRVYAVVMACVTVVKMLAMQGEANRFWHMAAGFVELAALGVIFWKTRKGHVWKATHLARLSMALVAGSGVLWLVAGRLDGLSVSTGMWTMFWRHLLAAALLPWNWREAVMAIAVMAVGNAGLVLVDVIRGATGFWTWVMSVALAPTTALPGVLLSWWRHSKFRARHQLHAESAMYRSLSREMEGARRVHEASLPPPIDTGETRLHYVYQPFRSLGGDLLYVHPIRPAPGEAFTVIVLDVAGHGIAAALTVNRIVGEVERIFAEYQSHGPAVRPAGGDSAGTGTDGPSSQAGTEHARRHPSDLTPTQLAHGLNRYVGLTLAHHGLFATAFIARVDPKRERLTWVNCGHPTSFLHTPSRPIRRLEGETMMLGVVHDEDLGAVDQTEWFGPGAVLLACTDGATEARDPSGQALLTEGFEKLVGSLAASEVPPADWPARLGMAVASYRDGPPDDDALLVAVVRTNAPAGQGTGREAQAVLTGAG